MNHFLHPPKVYLLALFVLHQKYVHYSKKTITLSSPSHHHLITQIIIWLCSQTITLLIKEPDNIPLLYLLFLKTRPQKSEYFFYDRGSITFTHMKNIYIFKAFFVNESNYSQNCTSAIEVFDNFHTVNKRHATMQDTKLSWKNDINTNLVHLLGSKSVPDSSGVGLVVLELGRLGAGVSISSRPISRSRVLLNSLETSYNEKGIRQCITTHLEVTENTRLHLSYKRGVKNLPEVLLL